MKNRISMALKAPILQQGFEIICKNLVEHEKENKGDKMKIDSLSAGEKMVYNFMKANGGITTLEAIQKLGCTRLSARIFELRSAGIPVYDEWETVKNRYGETCRVKRYYIGKKTK